MFTRYGIKRTTHHIVTGEPRENTTFYDSWKDCKQAASRICDHSWFEGYAHFVETVHDNTGRIIG